MSQTKAIRAGLSANVNAIANLQCSPYMLANPTPPCAYVAAGEITYDEAMHRGLDTLTFKVIALIGFSTDIGAQELLDELRAPIGASSIKAAIEADRTLAGACDDLIVTKVSAPQMYTLDIRGQSARPPCIGCEWTVEIPATPS